MEVQVLSSALTPRDLTVDSGGIALAVRDYGGEGPPLLMLHGSGDTLATWDEFGPLLTGAFHVAAYDAPGHGQSATPQGPLELTRVFDAVDDVAAALGFERPLLVGHSMGGMASLLYAGNRDCRAVVSLDAAYVRETSDAPAVYADEDEIRAAGFGRPVNEEELELACRALPAGPARESLRRAHVRRSDGLLERRPDVSFMLELTQLVGSVDSRVGMDDLYDAIGCPVLLVCGQQGWEEPEQRRRLESIPSQFPHVKIAWLDCGHAIHSERPRKLAELITAFAYRHH